MLAFVISVYGFTSLALLISIFSVNLPRPAKLMDGPFKLSFYHEHHIPSICLGNWSARASALATNATSETAARNIFRTIDPG
jgi:hypothetical protein